MENKRKASGVNGVELPGAGDNDRAAKRRKLQEEFGNLANGETPHSTTAYGLNILESIRATTDKNGRAVAPFFEHLPTKAANPDYYKKIRLPLSLEIIEQKLQKHGYQNLSSLEGDFKRLVSNAKETNPRQSESFGDAERIRKAVSNLMVKFNPAYKSGNYQAVATPLPPSPGPGADEDDEDAPGEADVEESTTADAEAGADADGEPDEEEEEEDDDEDAPGEEDEEDDDSSSRPRRRRGGRRATRRAKTNVAPIRQAVRSSSRQAKDTQYEDAPFEGLSFQQAQEKIVEDLLRQKDDGGEYQYYEVFVNLPSRALKDYYEIIAEPLSLKGLKKQVHGQHGRNEPTGISDFKSWAALEDQASLIWKNAYHYNEDGSDIYLMAQELEKQFKDLVAQAKQHVQEPPQQKIKLRVAQSSEPPAQPKKITIHVGGKSSTAGSPAPASGQAGEGDSTRNGTPMGRVPLAGSTSSVVNPVIDKAQSASISGPSPSPSVSGMIKPEDVARQSPAIPPQVNGMTTQQQFVPVLPPTGTLPNGLVQPPLPKQTPMEILEAQKYRPHPIKASEALMTKLVITSHPALQLEKRLNISIPASPTEYQQELVFNAPASYFRLQLSPHIAPFLEAQQREWKLNVLHDSQRLYPLYAQREKINEPVFDVNLRYGTNRLEVSLVAALPKGEKGPQGLNMELEKFVIHFNLLKHH